MTDHSDVNDRNSWSYPDSQPQLTEQPRTFVYQTQPFTISEQLAGKKKKEKKCHGNRKLQHFKRKCRARGLTEEQIYGLIQTKHHTISEPPISFIRKFRDLTKKIDDEVVTIVHSTCKVQGSLEDIDCKRRMEKLRHEQREHI